MATRRVTRSASRKSLNPTQPSISKSRRREPIPEYSSEESDNAVEGNVLKTTLLTGTPTKKKVHHKEDLNELSPVTPPKQKRQDHNCDKSLPATPSTLLKTLALTSPNKSSEHTTRKSLFSAKTETDLNSSEEENAPKSTYQQARKALHSQFPTDLPGREKEIEEIKVFIEDHLNNNTSGSIYISGPPGTGKTASLNLILENTMVTSKVTKIYINCTAIKSATSVYSRINKELHVKVTGKSERDNLAVFENYLKKKHNHILIVLDEIDQLETKNHSILYTIFEWPSRHQSKIILIGIANALDLTDRMLPRLQARCELKPKLLHFAPYSKSQIVNILTSRLKAAGVLDVFTPVALQMLAGKVASISGDVRRALDIGRRVVEMIDENKKADVLKSVENFANELGTAESQPARKVNPQQVVSVLNNVYGTSQNLTDESEDSFPLQQKIVICSLLLLLKKAKNKDVTIGKLHGVYTLVCNKRNLTAVDQVEFVGLCSLIETKGIIKIVRKKEPRMNKVILEWNENEVSDALKDKQLMSDILQDDSCLGKL